MIPRARLDIEFRELAYSAARCLAPGDATALRARVEATWPLDSAENMVCLSVRTGFDLVLQALALPAGSEVLLSAVTIPDMARIVRAHGLVPVPVDIDTATLAPDTAALERAHSPHSRVLVLAHLFGAWSDFDDAIAFARRHDLLVIEDIAQSAGDRRFTGNPQSDVRMFSFGPIKTDTALGGAILSFREKALGAIVRRIEASYPVQSRRHYATRVAKFTVLRAVATRAGISLFAAACWIAGLSYDEVIAKGAKGFPGDNLLRQLRRRAGLPLLATLAQRLQARRSARLRRRCTTGRCFSARLDASVHLPGRSARRRTHWLYPILADNPDAVVDALRDAGFDATRGATSLCVVEAPAGRPETRATRAHEMIDRMLFLPVYPEADAAALRRLARLVNRICGDGNADRDVAERMQLSA